MKKNLFENLDRIKELAGIRPVQLQESVVAQPSLNEGPGNHIDRREKVLYLKQCLAHKNGVRNLDAEMYHMAEMTDSEIDERFERELKENENNPKAPAPPTAFHSYSNPMEEMKGVGNNVEGTLGNHECGDK